MNISKKIWVRLRGNIGYIIFLSIFQVLLTIKFPGYAFLGTTANAIMKPIFGIVGMVCLIFLFAVSDKIEKGLFFNCATELDEPLRTYIRILTTVFSVLAFIAVIYHIGSKGFLNYSKSYYVLLYIYTVFLYYCLYLSVQKGKK